MGHAEFNYATSKSIEGSKWYNHKKKIKKILLFVNEFIIITVSGGEGMIFRQPCDIKSYRLG